MNEIGDVRYVLYRGKEWQQLIDYRECDRNYPYLGIRGWITWTVDEINGKQIAKMVYTKF